MRRLPNTRASGAPRPASPAGTHARSAGAATCIAVPRCQPRQRRWRARSDRDPRSAATIAALLPPSSRIERPKRSVTVRGDGLSHARAAPVALISGTLASSTSAMPACASAQQPCAQVAWQLRKAARVCSSSAWQAPSAVRSAFSEGFHTKRVAADQGERCIPPPDGDGKIERGNDAANAERMPGFHHPVSGPFGGDGQAVDLARQSDCKIAHVDQFLHLAQPFGEDLSGLNRNEPAERALVGCAAPRQAAAPVRRAWDLGSGAIRGKPHEPFRWLRSRRRHRLP